MLGRVLSTSLALFHRVFYRYFEHFIVSFVQSSSSRSSHQWCSLKKGVLKNFAKFTGKHLCQSLCFNKVEGLNFIEKETLAEVFFCKFCEIFKNTFSDRTAPCESFCISKSQLNGCVSADRSANI